ncbi:hypothetical protein MTY66_57760 [Mycolicibacterium sp. TY66]|uniref:hypothetical protein n=1 Tax=unclassified Mycolicibacterium TaxID=2636767 RepID=UPI001BB318A1|nr:MULTISPECIES: hypothetical protein [unclassified Mycolicibacterium]BCI84151.1 hypothetical protein MTY66_57760 [Mycolicibacterium sp. TY66]BCJ84229.1 hypothetical protein MTY81_56020 [Mycolicibacterium sp. TY81]
MDNWLNDCNVTATKLGGISRRTVFDLWKSGALASVTIGRRRFSSGHQIADYYIQRLESA